MTQGMVHVVDDDAAVLRGLRFFLESANYGVTTYASGDEFVARYRPSNDPECVVLDICMPGLSGLALHETFADRGWRVPVIFLTGHGKVPEAVVALKQGAFDFLEKPFADDVLLARVQAALDEDARRKSLRSEEQALAARLGSLTQREHQVAMRVAQGLPNKVIAQELGISPRTVEVYRAKAMSKTGVRSVAELVRMVVRQEPQLAAGQK